MTKCEELIAKCDFLLYCLRKKDKPSPGMERDMRAAKKKGKETKYIEDLLGYYPNVPQIMKKCGLSEFAETPQVVSATVIQ